MAEVKEDKATPIEEKPVKAAKPVEEKPERVELDVNGIIVHLLPDANDNWELLETLNAIEEGNTGRSVDAVKLLINDDTEYERVKTQLRNKNGVVKSSDMQAFFLDALDAISAKN